VRQPPWAALAGLVVLTGPLTGQAPNSDAVLSGLSTFESQ